jgi:hypothetical protein
MALLEDLGTYLQAAGLGTLGIDLFLGGLPLDAPNIASQDAVTALMETPGFPPQYVHSTLGADWEQPVVQIMVRGEPRDYAATREQAQEVFVALGKIRNQTLSGTYYFWCLPLQSPWKLADDDFARPIFTAQFRCGKSL